MLKKSGIATVLLILACHSHAFEPPKLTGLVVDEADILSTQVETRLTQKLKALEDATTNQLVVATVSSLDGMDIRQFGVELARAWEIGQQGKDNGVLLLVAPNERKLAIEVGYGLEGDFPDVLGAHIINNEILPHFYSRNYGVGIEAGVGAIIGVIAGDYKVQPARTRRDARKQYSWLLPVLWLPLLLVFFVGRIARRRGSSGIVTGVVAGALLGRSMGGGSSGFGGGFSGGGGSFGGGGASGSW